MGKAILPEIFRRACAQASNKTYSVIVQNGLCYGEISNILGGCCGGLKGEGPPRRSQAKPIVLLRKRDSVAERSVTFWGIGGAETGYPINYRDL